VVAVVVVVMMLKGQQNLDGTPGKYEGTHSEFFNEEGAALRKKHSDVVCRGRRDCMGRNQWMRKSLD
jgi:hypothetical protein